MPDFIIGFGILVLLLLIIATAMEEGPSFLLLLFFPVMLGAWLYHGIANNQVRQIGTFVSAEVDGVAVLNINGSIVNLNDALNSNIEPGTKFEVSTYQNFSRGVFCAMNSKYQIKEVK